MGFVFDSTFFAGVLSEPKWADYAIAVPLIDPEPWGMGLHKDDPKFAAFISDTVKDWHKSGFILELEKKWGIPPSAYLAEQNKKFK